jgi:hypothetical protein
MKRKTNEEAHQSVDKRINRLTVYEPNGDYRSVLKRITKKSKPVYQNVFVTNLVDRFSDIVRVLDTLDEMGRATSLQKLVYVYGEKVGGEKWSRYIEKQSVSNTFEYKQRKYGMTREEFNEYNRNRSSTLANFVARHGSVKGEELWQNYRVRQGFTNTKDHLGDRYQDVCSRKAHTYDVYLQRYGNEQVALSKLDLFYSNLKCFYSQKSQDLFERLVRRGVFDRGCVYYASLNTEYGVYDSISNKYFRYDFVCTKTKMCIEFHGDHYHGNPRLYKPDDTLVGRGMAQTTAKEAWLRDMVKLECIERERGFRTVVVWEHDYDKDRDATIERIREHVELH